MRIHHASESELVLSGRRQDGEVGEPGLWLLWLVGLGFAVAGLFCLGLEDVGARWMGAILGLAGASLLLFGLHRLARRESLHLDLQRKTLTYSHRAWPGPSRIQFEASFDDVKEIRLRKKMESPGGSKGQASAAYEVHQARLLVRPRRVVELERLPDEGRVRQLAETVARALETTLAG